MEITADHAQTLLESVIEAGPLYVIILVLIGVLYICLNRKGSSNGD